MKPIEGIEFREHGIGPGNYHAIVECNDGTTLSIIQCDGTGDICKRVRMPQLLGDRGRFYGNTTGENVFEVWDLGHGLMEDPLGWQTAEDVVKLILEHGGMRSAQG